MRNAIARGVRTLLIGERKGEEGGGYKPVTLVTKQTGHMGNTFLRLIACAVGPTKVKVYCNDDIKALLQPAVSAHQSGVHTLMALAKLHGKMPGEIALIAVSAITLEMSAS